MTDWLIYRGTGEPHGGADTLPPPPPWRAFDGGPARPVPPGPGPDSTDGPWRGKLGDLRIASSYRPDPEAVELVNAALYLRRPLLVTGKPGTGKSSLAYSVAYELGLGPVLRWPITSRSTLSEGLYSYDAIGRLQDVNLGSQDGTADAAGIGDYIRLGPLGTALLPFTRPRALLIDEIDKSDIDLPNDLLNLFEYPAYTVHELARIADRATDVKVMTEDAGDRVMLRDGQVLCQAFPFIVLTSNGEREFPPAFMRRCLRLDLPVPSPEQLAGIVASHLGPDLAAAGQDLLEEFVAQRSEGDLAADQLLNAVYLTSYAAREPGADRARLAQSLLRHLDRLA
ncbi:MAG: MoxR family ATPase [Streptosporangiaceae bacterium]